MNALALSKAVNPYETEVAIATIATTIALPKY